MSKVQLTWRLTFAVLVCAIQFSILAPAFATAKSEYDAGVAAYKAGQYKQAAASFWQSISHGNISAQAWVYLAHSHAASGNKGEAIKIYRQITKIFKGQPAEKVAWQALSKLDPGNRWTEHPTSGKTASAGTASANTADVDSGVSSLPERARIFYRDDGGRVMVSVRINGRPIEMMLDTGAPNTVLDKEHLQELGMSLPQGKADGQTGGASNSALVDYWNIPASVQVGPIKRDMQIEVMEDMHGRPLLGQGFFKDFDYTIDRSGQCIEFRRKGIVASRSTNYSLPFEFRESGHRIVVQVEINGRKGPMMFDSGNSAAGISFSSEQEMKKWGLKVPEDARLTRTTGVSGSGQCYAFDVPRVKMGPIEKSDVSVTVDLEADDDEGLPLVGQEMWEGWQYTIDMKNKQIHFLRR